MRSDRRTPPVRSLLLVLIALAAVASCTLLEEPAPKPVAPPGPAFPHDSHLAKGLECVDCHEGVEDADEAGMPDPEFCMECHEEEEVEEGEKPKVNPLDAFLTGPDGAAAWKSVTGLDEELVFSHLKHVEAEVACSACHTGIEESKRITFDLAINDMDACMACHTEKKTANECATCHTYVGTDWKPDNHTRMWETMHGQIVRRGTAETRTEDCSMCHTQDSCTTCHQQNAPRDHVNAWRVGGGHGLSASMDRERCDACHETQSCQQCHETNRPRSHRGSWGSSRNRHCRSCHIPLQLEQPGGCGVCHQGTPSHDMAPPKPSGHKPDDKCSLCHTPLSHADNGQNCNLCHR